MEFKLPELGESIEYGDVVDVLVNPGDTVEDGQNVLELETDKAVVEVPITVSGKVSKIHVKAGDRVKIGDSILTLEASTASETKEEATPAPPPTPPTSERSTENNPAPPPPGPESSGTGNPGAGRTATAQANPLAGTHPGAAPSNGDRSPPAPAGPATRRLARQLGVDLHAVSGTGRGGRITGEDVQEFVRGVLSGPSQAGGGAVEPPLPDFSKWGEIERQPLSGIRRKTAENMAVAWQTIPHVTQFDSADITQLEAARRAYQSRVQSDTGAAKVTVTVLAIKACLVALREMPQFNSSLDLRAGDLIVKKHYDIGMAVDTEHGLLVPVVRDVDKKTISEIANELQDLATRARARKVGIDEMQGGTFTITNLGGIGGTGFTPIVNYPQVAILGMARAKQEYVVVDGQPEVRLLLPLSLSYDHRVVDGANGARFLRRIATLLSEPFQLLLGL